MTLSQLSPPGEGTRDKPADEWSAIEAVNISCWGAFSPWAESVSRRLNRPHAMLAALRSEAVRSVRTALTSEGSTGIGRLSAPTAEYTGEPLWLTGTVSKIC